MAKIALRFDEDVIATELPEKNVQIFLPSTHSPKIDELDLVKSAMENPLVDENKQQIGRLAGKSIAIAINDQTRPLPHAVLLPCLLDFLHSKGAEREKITFFIATGTHRKLTDEEIEVVLPGNLSKEYACECHDCDAADKLMYLGHSARQTPVYVNRGYYQSDLKVVVGNIEPHHFMGFSGGMKTAAIGLTGRETIQKNHSMLPDPHARMALYNSNPMRMDVEEIGRMIGVDYALNVVLNDDKQIVNAFWGDPHQVMLAGIPAALESCQMDVSAADCGFDLVIASAGGFPKDINLYQSQKALTNACLFSKKGGVIILAAGCRDGGGSEKFTAYLTNKPSWQAVLDDFPRRPFEIGPHKAYQLALQARYHHLILVSRMPPAEVRRYLLTPAASLREALTLALPFLPANYRTAVLPFATHSMPKMESAGK